MTPGEKKAITVPLTILILGLAGLGTMQALLYRAEQKANAPKPVVATPVVVEQEPVLYVFPLTKNKMVEIYERAFFGVNREGHISVEERHKFAMGAVQTAPSRYNQLMQEIAKHDEN